MIECGDGLWLYNYEFCGCCQIVSIVYSCNYEFHLNWFMHPVARVSIMVSMGLLGGSLTKVTYSYISVLQPNLDV
jgi:hypothetical protein